MWRGYVTQRRVGIPLARGWMIRGMDTNPDRTVYRFAKNKREEVRATLGEFKGMPVVSLRVWAVADDDERPTPKGLTVRVEHVPHLLAAVQAIAEASEAA